MQNTHLQHLVELLIATLLISTSGVLGKFIAMPPPVIIWWRCGIAVVVLYVYCRYKKIDLRIKSTKDKRSFLLAALLLGVHWVSYFYALKFSNVALAMLSLFAFPVITALLDPLFFNQKLKY